MMITRVLPVIAVLLVVSPGPVHAAEEPRERRPVRADDVLRLRSVGEPSLSPDGQWVAYTVTTPDAGEDRFVTQVHLARLDGSDDFQVTFGKEGASDPAFSPDGRYLSFLATRADSEAEGAGRDQESQLFLMRRAGGEAQQITRLPGGVEAYDWSPDSRRIVLVSLDPDPNKPADEKDKRNRPVVTERYHFKEDVVGYKTERRTHLYLLDLSSRAAAALTSGPHDHASASFSPDGMQIAFVSSRGPDDPDRTGNTDVFVMEAQPGAQPRRLTDWHGPDHASGSGPLTWSPDSRLIAYLQGEESRFLAYDQETLAVVPAAGGPARLLTTDLDRPVSDPAFTADGKEILFLVEDDRVRYLARTAVDGGPARPISREPRVISGFASGDGRPIVVTAAAIQQPAELFVLEDGRLRRLTRHNDALLAELALGSSEEFRSRSGDGTQVNGIVTRPRNAAPGRRLPAVLLIHGGPDGQDAHEFDLERELLAANGYLVIQANYRGSSGRGSTFQKAIYADWGNKEVVDLLGALDHFVVAGLADPARIGSVGWSYGGILTNYLIASDTRFKAAVSTAGSAMMVLWGIDQYPMQYELELGPPWKSRDLWVKLSYPFFQADRIRTPTLYLCGEKDFNVPVAGCEQMYQALRSLDVPTRLVVYPGLFHGLASPAALQDRLTRQLEWLAKYMGSSG